MESLILRHKNWRFLLRDLSDRYRDFNGITNDILIRLLTAPATISYWIATNHKELLAKKSLNILIVGASDIEYIDQGVWYNAIPLFLGRQMTVSVSLVGVQFPKPVNTNYGGLFSKKATKHKMYFSEFIEQNKEIFDVAVMFNPGLYEHHDEWFKNHDVEKLASLNIPVLMSFYDSSESIVDRLMLSAHGFDVLKDPITNQFPIETGVASAGALHRYISELPKLTHSHKDDHLIRLCSINEYVNYFQHKTTNDMSGFMGVGKEMTCNYFDSTCIYLGCGAYISTQDKHIYWEQIDDIAEFVVSDEAMNKFKIEKSPYQRYIYALEILSDLMEEYDFTLNKGLFTIDDMVACFNS